MADGSGLAPAIRHTLGVPVLCSLQGEDSFLDTLPEPYKTKAWDAFRANNSSVARYLATSDYYRGVMKERRGGVRRCLWLKKDAPSSLTRGSKI